jgi:hypothetical protein
MVLLIFWADHVYNVQASSCKRADHFVVGDKRNGARLHKKHAGTDADHWQSTTRRWLHDNKQARTDADYRQSTARRRLHNKHAGTDADHRQSTTRRWLHDKQARTGADYRQSDAAQSDASNPAQDTATKVKKLGYHKTRVLVMSKTDIEFELADVCFLGLKRTCSKHAVYVGL